MRYLWKSAAGALTVAAALVAITLSAAAQGPAVLPPNSSLGEAPGIEEKADSLMQQMSDYLASLKRFTVSTEATIEVVLKTGQKLQYASASETHVHRPNKLRSERKGDNAHLRLYYDGKSVTLYGARQNYYAVAPAPPTLDAATDEARDRFGLAAPGADMLYSNVWAGLKTDVISGFCVGPSFVRGIPCQHLAFRGKVVDFQVWIQDGSKPLPVKYVITSKNTPSCPEFGVVFTKWNVSPGFADDIFTFTPPKGSMKIKFLELPKPGQQGAEGGSK